MDPQIFYKRHFKIKSNDFCCICEHVNLTEGFNFMFKSVSSFFFLTEMLNV